MVGGAVLGCRGGSGGWGDHSLWSLQYYIQRYFLGQPSCVNPDYIGNCTHTTLTKHKS